MATRLKMTILATVSVLVMLLLIAVNIWQAS